MRWLLDTHVMTWLVEGSDELSRHARHLLDDQAARSGLLVSAISFWEVGTLCKARRLTLSEPLSEWRAHVLEAPGITELPLTGDVALESTQLPGALHGDPADRMLVATARAHRLTLVTRDGPLLAYGKQGHVTVLGV